MLEKKSLSYYSLQDYVKKKKINKIKKCKRALEQPVKRVKEIRSIGSTIFVESFCHRGY